MNFLYLDESGTPSFNDKDAVFCVVGIDIDESKGKLLTYEYSLLKHRYFPKFHYADIRSLPTIKEKIDFLKRMEVKNILTPGDFSYPHRTFMYKVINLCTKYNIKIFCVTAFKDKLKSRSQDWLYPACIKILTRTYNRYLTTKGTRGIIVMDSRGELLDSTMTFIQSSFLLWGKEGKQFDKVIDLPFFTPSHHSAALQISHFFAYLTAMQYNYIYYKQTKYAYLNPLWLKLCGLFYGSPTGKEIITWS